MDRNKREEKKKKAENEDGEDGQEREREAYARRLRTLAALSLHRRAVDLEPIIQFIAGQMAETNKSNIHTEIKEKHTRKPKSRKNEDETKKQTLGASTSTSQSGLKREDRSAEMKMRPNPSNSNRRLDTKESNDTNETKRKRTNTKESDTYNVRKRKRTVSTSISQTESDVRHASNSTMGNRIRSMATSNLGSDISDLGDTRSSQSQDQSHSDENPPQRSALSELDKPLSPLPELIVEYDSSAANKHDQPPEFYEKLEKKMVKFWKRYFIEGKDVDWVSSDESGVCDDETARKSNRCSYCHDKVPVSSQPTLASTSNIQKSLRPLTKEPNNAANTSIRLVSVNHNASPILVLKGNSNEPNTPLQDRTVHQDPSTSSGVNKRRLRSLRSLQINEPASTKYSLGVSQAFLTSLPDYKKISTKTLSAHGLEVSSGFPSTNESTSSEGQSSPPRESIRLITELGTPSTGSSSDGSMDPSPTVNKSDLNKSTSGPSRASSRTLASFRYPYQDASVDSETSILNRGRRDQRFDQDEDSSDSSDAQHVVVMCQAEVHAPPLWAGAGAGARGNHSKDDGYSVRDQNEEEPEDAVRGPQKAVDDEPGRSVLSMQTHSTAESSTSQETPADNVGNEKISTVEDIEQMRCPLPHRAVSSLGNEPYNERIRNEDFDKLLLSLKRNTMESMDVEINRTHTRGNHSGSVHVTEYSRHSDHAIEDRSSHDQTTENCSHNVQATEELSNKGQAILLHGPSEVRDHSNPATNQSIETSSLSYLVIEARDSDRITEARSHSDQAIENSSHINGTTERHSDQVTEHRDQIDQETGDNNVIDQNIGLDKLELLTSPVISKPKLIKLQKQNIYHKDKRSSLNETRAQNANKSTQCNIQSANVETRRESKVPSGSRLSESREPSVRDANSRSNEYMHPRIRFARRPIEIKHCLCPECPVNAMIDGQR